MRVLFNELGVGRKPTKQEKKETKITFGRVRGKFILNHSPVGLDVGQTYFSDL